MSVAAMLFFAAFGAITIMDRSHGDIGSELRSELVETDVRQGTGNLQDEMIPEGLFIFGAGQDSKLDFEVTNKDPDNDIDTIEISIPGSTIMNGSSEWYESALDHQWDMTAVSPDVSRFTARDDWFGRVIGGSAQYDVVGNLDDALDHVPENASAVGEISESVILSVEFTAPSVPGIKTGDDSIDLKVGDLQTESSDEELSSVDPYPYPYVVAENGSRYLVIVLDREECDLEVMYGEKQLFSPSRAGNFMVSEYGYKFDTADGETVAVLLEPEDMNVKPLVKTSTDGLSGEFSLDIFNITVMDITVPTFEIGQIVNDYREDVPDSPGDIVDTDMDDDGVLNELDDDMDGDDIPNTEDRFPRTFNRMPVILSITDSTTIVQGEVLTLAVEAEDPDDETLSFIWRKADDPDWEMTSNSIEISGLSPGEHIFMVSVTDALGNVKEDSIVVDVLPNRQPVITSVTASPTAVHPEEPVALTVEAEDEENDPLTYTWSLEGDVNFNEQGSTVTVEDLDEGTHIFTVEVSDGISTVQDSITVEVTEEDEPEGFPILLLVIILAILLIVIAFVVFFIIRKNSSEDEQPLIEEPLPETEPTPVDPAETEPEQQAYGEAAEEEGPVNEPVLENPEYEIPTPEGSVEGTEAAGTDWTSTEVCPECSAPLSENDSSCSNCGAEFEVRLECPSCGGDVPSDSDSCPNCGMRFTNTT